MDHATSKQLAQSATQKQGLANSKAAMYSREMDSLSEGDHAKRNDLKGKIISLQNQSQTYAMQASEYRTEATRAELKENDKAFKELEEEQQKVQKEEEKLQKKIQEESDEKAKTSKLDGQKTIKEDSADDLLFLNEDRDFNPIATDIVDFTVVKPAQEQGQATDSSKKDSEEEKLIKGVGASGSTGK